jgi:hypothetical protein
MAADLPFQVGGVGLPVDAVGVDLHQDRNAVPGAAGCRVAGFHGKTMLRTRFHVKEGMGRRLGQQARR